MKLSVVVPFYNELRTLPTVIDRLLQVDFSSLGLGTELIFVDDSSTPTPGAACSTPLPRDDVEVIVHPTNRGKGAAVKTGLEAATGDILCIQDADLEYDPRDLPALIEPILDGDYEIVYGSRFRGSAAGLYYTHRIANRLLNLMVNVAFNRYLSDVYTGYKVFTRQAYRGLRLTAKTFTVEMELTAHFLRKGLVIYEVPISYRARTYAEGKKIHFRDGFLAAGAVARYFRRPPERTGPAAHGALRRAGGDARRRAAPPSTPSAWRTWPPPTATAATCTACSPPTWARPCSRSAPASATSPPSCWTATAWSSTTTTRSACAPSTSASASAPASSPPRRRAQAQGRAARRLGGRPQRPGAHGRRRGRPPGHGPCHHPPGGQVLLVVPAYPSLAGAFDEALGHLRRYTPDSLRDAVETRRPGPRGHPPGQPPRRPRLVGRRPGRPPGPPHPALVRLYDRLVVPAERLLERRLQPRFGQSILCIRPGPRAREPAPGPATNAPPERRPAGPAGGAVAGQGAEVEKAVDDRAAEVDRAGLGEIPGGDRDLRRCGTRPGRPGRPAPGRTRSRWSWLGSRSSPAACANTPGSRCGTRTGAGRRRGSGGW